MPDVSPLARPFYDGFMVLQRGRMWAGGGMGAFPCGLAYGDITAYGKGHGFGDPAAIDEFVELIYEMDAVYLDDHKAKTAKAVKRMEAERNANKG